MYYLQCIDPVHRVKHSFQVVKTILPPGNNVQAKIDFAIGKDYQKLVGIVCLIFLFSMVNFVPDGDCPKIVFLFQYLA